MRIASPRALTRWWDGSGAARRATWSIGAAIAAIAVVGATVATPLRDAVERTRDDVAHNRLVRDVARERAAEIATLARAARAPRANDARTAIERVLGARAIHFVTAPAQDAGGPVRIVIESSSFDSLVQALDALAREDGVRVAEAVITARVEPGTVRAELALAR